MAGNTLTIDFAGDAKKLQAAAKQATGATDDVAAAAKDVSAAHDKAGQAADRHGQKLGDLGSATTGAVDAVDSLGGGMQALADIQDYARSKAQRLARANVDVMQATEDMAQATRDASQASIDSAQADVDLEQARLDQAKATKDYAEAVQKHGKNSIEARQATIDLAQAGIDVKQATEDSAQAVRDASQANIDAQESQVNLNDAMHEANPPQLSEWAEQIGLVTPLITALIGVTSLITVAQWAWNAAQAASPTTWIILAIAALVAIVVVIGLKMGWLQDAWRAAWGGIRRAAEATGRWFRDTLWNRWIRGTFNSIVDKARDAVAWFRSMPGRLGRALASVASAISRPFRSAFNAIASAWNNTIGRLSWSVPGWVPGIGGNSISVPRLPTYHGGGKVPGMPGQEVPIMALAGERISPANTGGGDGGGWVAIRGDAIIDALTQAIADRIGATGGRAAQLGIRVV